jgi:hypothetical protein
VISEDGSQVIKLISKIPRLEWKRAKSAGRITLKYIYGKSGTRLYWIRLAQDRFQFLVLVNTVMKLRIP